MYRKCNQCGSTNVKFFPANLYFNGYRCADCGTMEDYTKHNDDGVWGEKYYGIGASKSDVNLEAIADTASAL